MIIQLADNLRGLNAKAWFCLAHGDQLAMLGKFNGRINWALVDTFACMSLMSGRTSKNSIIYDNLCIVTGGLVTVAGWDPIPSTCRLSDAGLVEARCSVPLDIEIY
jgi:hypothetical protein